jgi:hypothetical protein
VLSLIQNNSLYFFASRFVKTFDTLYIQIFLNFIISCFKDFNKEHIHLKRTSASSNGKVFTCVSGKRPVPSSALPLLSPFPKPQLCSSWRFNPGSVRTSSGSKSPAAWEEIWSYYIKSMLHSNSTFIVFWSPGYESKFNFRCLMKKSYSNYMKTLSNFLNRHDETIK